MLLSICHVSLACQAFVVQLFVKIKTESLNVIVFHQQEAFEKCWAHSPLRAAARRMFYIAIHQVSLLSHAATVARRLRIDVHDDDDDNNDNA